METLSIAICRDIQSRLKQEHFLDVEVRVGLDTCSLTAIMSIIVSDGYIWYKSIWLEEWESLTTEFKLCPYEVTSQEAFIRHTVSEFIEDYWF